MSNVQELFNQGLTSMNLGNPKEALVYFTKVLDIEPLHQIALVKKGNVLGKLGKYHQAIPFYDKALSQDPEDFLALVNKGLALHFLKQYKEAIVCYNLALKIKPTSLVVQYNKASSLVLQNKINDGLEILKKVVENDFSYSAKAKFDIDFQKISHLNEFKEITLP